jgi:hypothetical protein
MRITKSPFNEGEQVRVDLILMRRARAVGRGAPGLTFGVAFLKILDTKSAEAPIGTI